MKKGKHWGIGFITILMEQRVPKGYRKMEQKMAIGKCSMSPAKPKELANSMKELERIRNIIIVEISRLQVSSGEIITMESGRTMTRKVILKDLLYLMNMEKGNMKDII